MKRLAITLSLIIACAGVKAQEVTYALPYTSFTVEVDAVEDIHFAGPYSQFAKEMLNMDVPAADVRNTYIKEIRIIPKVEADPTSSRYSCPSGSNVLLEMSAQGLISFANKAEASNLSWRFVPEVSADFSDVGITGPEKTRKQITYHVVKTDTAEVRYPVEHIVTVTKTLEDKAADAAESILKARQERYNIATGNTDASYSGESMAAALAELTKVEQEYMKMFTGYSTKREFSASFEVLPSAAARTNRYTAFYLTEDGRIVKDNKSKSKPYELEFIPSSVPPVRPDAAQAQDPKKKPDKAYSIHYRIPAICKVRLLEDGNPVLETRIPVYQFGKEAELVINQ
ncbi:MAG: DUF4831 family protein [Bacteroidales bacterium]|nr:DUF4831 family protein [Bacteroidales bacterium]